MNPFERSMWAGINNIQCSIYSSYEYIYANPIENILRSKLVLLQIRVASLAQINNPVGATSCNCTMGWNSSQRDRHFSSWLTLPLALTRELAHYTHSSITSPAFAIYLLEMTPCRRRAKNSRVFVLSESRDELALVYVRRRCFCYFFCCCEGERSPL